MKKFLLGLVLLAGCANKRMHGIDMNNLSGTPCIDGVVYNIKQAGCEVFYWGQIDGGSTLKLRCSYSDHKNFYTTVSFYVVPIGSELQIEGSYAPFCADTQSMVFLKLPKNEL